MTKAAAVIERFEQFAPKQLLKKVIQWDFNWVV